MTTKMTRIQALQAAAKMIAESPIADLREGAGQWHIHQLQRIQNNPESWEDRATVEWFLGEKVGCDLEVSIGSMVEIKVSWSGTGRTPNEALFSATLYAKVAQLAVELETRFCNVDIVKEIA